MQSFTWYDILILGILVFFTMRGAIKGVIFQIASLAGIVLCFLFANGISGALGPYVHLEPPLNNWVIFAAAYFGFTFVCYMIARALNDVIERAKMKDFDRNLGAVFGFIKGVALSLVLTYFVVTMSVTARESLKNSYSGRYAAIIMDHLHPVMPERLHEAVADYIHLLDHDGLDLNAHKHDHSQPSKTSPLGTPASFPSFPSTDPFASTPANDPPPPLSSGGSSLWNQLQGIFTNESQRVVNDALQRADPQSRSQMEQALATITKNMTPQEKANLQQQITQVGANQLKQYLDSRLGSLGTPVQPATGNPAMNQPVNPLPTPLNAGQGTQLTAHKTQLMKDIAAIYTPLPQLQQNIEQDIAIRTAGVPDQVVVAALDDWKGDLQGRRPDPDPQTNAEYPVEIRIVRQLQAAGIRLDQLSVDVQRRLNGGQAQSGAGNSNSPL